MKYIDADKLNAEIKRYKQEAAIARFDNAGENADYFQGKVDLCNDLTHIIASLQREQPDGYNRAMLEVKSKVDKLYDETSIGLNEYDAGLYNGIAETCMKLRGFIKARISSQEQPEVDLEKEIDAFWNPRFNLGWDEHSALSMNHSGFASIARHFYELGLNARKEDEK